MFLLLLCASCFHTEPNFQIHSINCLYDTAKHSESTCLLTNTFFLSFFHSPFPLFVPNCKYTAARRLNQVQCTCLSTGGLELSDQFVLYKRHTCVLQSWQAVFFFIAMCSGCLGLLMSLKGFFLFGKVDFSLEVELLREGFWVGRIVGSLQALVQFSL